MASILSSVPLVCFTCFSSGASCCGCRFELFRPPPRKSVCQLNEELLHASTPRPSIEVAASIPHHLPLVVADLLLPCCSSFAVSVSVACVSGGRRWQCGVWEGTLRWEEQFWFFYSSIAVQDMCHVLLGGCFVGWAVLDGDRAMTPWTFSESVWLAWQQPQPCHLPGDGKDWWRCAICHTVS